MNAMNLTLTPLDKRLLAWLDTDVPRFERYITAHPEVADRIDQLLALGDDVQRLLNGALEDVLAVPLGFVDRLSGAIVGSGDTSSANVAMDLFGIGGQTISMWLNPEPTRSNVSLLGLGTPWASLPDVL